MLPKKKSKNLAEKISEAVTNVPKLVESDDEAEETRAKVVDYDSESEDDIEDFKNQFRKSNLRKRNISLLEESNKRYAAKKVSKNKLFNQYNSSDENEDEDGSENMDDIQSNESSAEGAIDNESLGDEEKFDSSDKEDYNDGSNSELSDNVQDYDNKNTSSNEMEDDDDDEEESDYDDLDESTDITNPLRRDRGTEKDTITTVSETNITLEIEKGNAVRSQLQLWENFLEMRIKLQKCLVDSNKMPQYDAYKNYSKNKEFKRNCKSVGDKLKGVLGNLLDLQSKLLNQFSETKGILLNSKKNKTSKVGSTNTEDSMDEEIPSDFEDEDGDNENENENNSLGSNVEEVGSSESDNEKPYRPPKKMLKLDELEQTISENHKNYREYRNSVIQKWNEKVRISTGAISKGSNQPALQQIEFALANKDKLKRKTQLKRSEYEIIGKNTSSLEENNGRRLQEYDEEIYDDDDFYHQLLKELIEFKSADIQDPLKLSQQWVQLQNMRSKMKRKIDTRATKGRRLRYDVHQKLVNFMAPISVNDTWTDHAKNELYSSLFGKIKPISQVQQN